MDMNVTQLFHEPPRWLHIHMYIRTGCQAVNCYQYRRSELLYFWEKIVKLQLTRFIFLHQFSYQWSDPFLETPEKSIDNDKSQPHTNLLPNKTITITWKFREVNGNWLIPILFSSLQISLYNAELLQFIYIIIIIIIIIINTFEHANFIKKLLMESPLRRRTKAD